MIALARHGETTWNRERRFQGNLDAEVPLNDRGREQAHELAKVCEPEGFVALYASPLARARETAEIVGAHLGLQPEYDDRLKESDVGDWTGRYKADIERDEAKTWARYLAAGDDWVFPGGESLEEQMERVVDALVDITQAHRLPALVVCHRGVIRCALAHTHNRGLDTYHEWTIPNGELVRL
ncbi:MAG TPA: histidine phosphatase family protein [Solirubrobacteraceae bacterium]|nr:histidine phosphatase family protein [Solirubrobacteraceae bacterium]